MTGVAVVGCGTISDQYLQTLSGASDVAVVFCADLDVPRAAAVAEKYSVPKHGTVAEALASPDVSLVVNLTIPAAHVEVTTAAIAAGKHVWSEKPLAMTPDAAAELVQLAADAGLRLGCAPDTVLGAGPLFDMGPYYLTALSLLFGPVTSVAATGLQARATRVIGAGPRAGTEFPVEVPTYVSALLSYAGGAAATIVLSFDSPASHQPLIEVAGTEATMALPDPNRFDGDVRVKRTGDKDWTVYPAEAGDGKRGLGVLDMVRSIRSGVPHRCSGELALHVVDTMTAIAESAQTGSFVPVRTTFS